MGQSFEQSHARFNTTSWTLIDALHNPVHPHHRQALSDLIENYWPPVYATLRRLGRDQEAAAEITQAFFVEVVLHRHLFENARPDRGRLRTLLLTAVKRYVIDHHRRQAVRSNHLKLEQSRLAHEEIFLTAEPEQDPEQIFDRRWAVSILEETLRRCEQYFRANDCPHHWTAFDAFLIQPALGSIASPSLKEIAAEHHFPSAQHVASALKVVRKRFLILLREVISSTVRNPEEQEAEYHHCLNLFG